MRNRWLVQPAVDHRSKSSHTGTFRRRARTVLVTAEIIGFQSCSSSPTRLDAEVPTALRAGTGPTPGQPLQKQRSSRSRCALGVVSGGRLNPRLRCRSSRSVITRRFNGAFGAPAAAAIVPASGEQAAAATAVWAMCARFAAAAAAAFFTTTAAAATAAVATTVVVAAIAAATAAVVQGAAVAVAAATVATAAATLLAAVACSLTCRLPHVVSARTALPPGIQSAVLRCAEAEGGFAMRCVFHDHTYVIVVPLTTYVGMRHAIIHIAGCDCDQVVTQQCR